MIETVTRGIEVHHVEIPVQVQFELGNAFKIIEPDIR